ncbi:hypothetical protein FRB90_010734 [Tulasnella sp. 427]|nr:hypothetical protein FRB90_010734 [Tulasnella sp. 427]
MNSSCALRTTGLLYKQLLTDIETVRGNDQNLRLDYGAIIPPSLPPLRQYLLKNLQWPSQPPVLPSQRPPASVLDVKERVTVNGTPSQTVVDGKLVIGHDRSVSLSSIVAMLDFATHKRPSTVPSTSTRDRNSTRSRQWRPPRSTFCAAPALVMIRNRPPSTNSTSSDKPNPPLASPSRSNPWTSSYENVPPKVAGRATPRIPRRNHHAGFVYSRTRRPATPPSPAESTSSRSSISSHDTVTSPASSSKVAAAAREYSLTRHSRITYYKPAARLVRPSTSGSTSTTTNSTNSRPSTAGSVKPSPFLSLQPNPGADDFVRCPPPGSAGMSTKQLDPHVDQLIRTAIKRTKDANDALTRTESNASTSSLSQSQSRPAAIGTTTGTWTADSSPTSSALQPSASAPSGVPVAPTTSRTSWFRFGSGTALSKEEKLDRDLKPGNFLVTTTGLADYSPISPRVHQPNLGEGRHGHRGTRQLWARARSQLRPAVHRNKPVDMYIPRSNPTTHGEYGLDEHGRVRGGGDWAKGVLMAGAVGYTFKGKLFDRNVLLSLIGCIADLIRYDLDRRLTVQQCKDHPGWRETENTQRGTIATQPQAPHDRHSSSRQQQPQQRHAELQQQHTSSNKGLRAAIAGMGLYRGSSSQRQQQPQSHQQQSQQPGFMPGHARTSSNHAAGPSNGLLKPAFNAARDVVPSLPPLTVPLSHPEGASTSSSAATSVPHYRQPQPHHLHNSLSNGNLMVHRQGDQVFSPISSSASPGLFSPVSQPGDISPNPDASLSLRAMQYEQVSAVHYAGCGCDVRERRVGRQDGELDLPPLPWNAPAGGSGSPGMSVASQDSRGKDQMDISIGSLELPPIQEQQVQPIPIKQEQQPQFVPGPAPIQPPQPPQPQPQVVVPPPQPERPLPPPPVQQSSGSKFGLSIFGKSRFGLFKHSDSCSSSDPSKAAATVLASKPANTSMAASSPTRIRRVNGLQASAAAATAVAPQRHLEKKSLAKMRQEEQRAN